MSSIILPHTRHVENITAAALSTSTADQEKQLLRERDHDHDQDQHYQTTPHTDDGTKRIRRPMASRRNLFLGLLVCCFVTIGLASAKFHQSALLEDVSQADVDSELHRSLSSDIRELLKKFTPAGDLVNKRQASNATTSAIPTSTFSVSSSSAEPTSTPQQSTVQRDTTTPAATTPVTTAVQTTVETQTTIETQTNQAPTPTPSPTAASSVSSFSTSSQGTTSTSTSSSEDETTSGSSKPSSTLVTATLTSTLPDGGISVVTQTSYSYVNPQASGSTTTPEASLQTHGAAPPKQLLQPAMAAAVGGFWLVRNLV